MDTLPLSHNILSSENTSSTELHIIAPLINMPDEKIQWFILFIVWICSITFLIISYQTRTVIMQRVRNDKSCLKGIRMAMTDGHQLLIYKKIARG